MWRLDRKREAGNWGRRSARPASQLRNGGYPNAKGAAGIMTTKMTKRKAAIVDRHIELKTMLEERRRELTTDVHGRLHHVRADGRQDREVLDEGESWDADIQEDIELALIQMKSETLAKVNDALRRLGDGTYGRCFECGEPIAEARLRALPFAARCKDCEEARESVEQGEQLHASRRGSSAFLFDVSH